MKFAFNTLFCLLCAFQLAAQRDSVTIEISTDTSAFEKQRFIDRYDYLTGTKEPLKRVLKWDLLGVLPTYSNNNLANPSGINLAGEFKVSKAFSLQGSFSWDYGNPLFFCDNCLKESFLTVGLEARHYLGMASRIRKGKSANNMTGAYTGLEILKTLDMRNLEAHKPFMAARVGFQTRLFRRGYLDWSYGLGYQASGINRKGGTYISSRVRMGLMFGTPKPTQTASYCEVLNCFREERSMFKIDLLGIAQFNQRYTVLNPNVTWESKLGNSAFSLNVRAATALWWSKIENFSYVKDDSVYSYSGTSRNISLYGGIQPRWYFLQKNRIAKGKDGNNLSGLYVATEMGYSRTLKSTLEDLRDISFGHSTFSITPSVGYQQRLFKNLFVNYDWRLGGFAYLTKEKQWVRNTQFLDFFLFHSIKIGLAF